MLPFKRVRRKAILTTFLVFVCFTIHYFLITTYYTLPQHAIQLDDSSDWFHPRCNCLKGKTRTKMLSSEMQSTCPSSSFRGFHQKVVSYSFYGDTDSGYFKGVEINTKSVEYLYPGWTVRLYHDIKPHNAKGMDALCKTICKYSHLDECYVGDIREQFDKIEFKFGMIWRFLVLGDPTVDVFAVRDLDSPVYQREVDAVHDWLSTNTTFHIMRDNPAHVTYILGGMWGARNTKNVTMMQKIRSEIVDESRSKQKSYDQALLTTHVWPRARSDMVAHDSYLCSQFPNTRPWPTQRVNRTFVGDMYGISITQTCPERCRPLDHHDWIYC